MLCIIKQKTKKLLEVLEYADPSNNTLDMMHKKIDGSHNREMATDNIVLCKMIVPSRVTNQICWSLFSLVVTITVIVT